MVLGTLMRRSGRPQTGGSSDDSGLSFILTPGDEAQVWNMCKKNSLIPSKKPPTRENRGEQSVYFLIFG